MILCGPTGRNLYCVCRHSLACAGFFFNTVMHLAKLYRLYAAHWSAVFPIVTPSDMRKLGKLIPPCQITYYCSDFIQMACLKIIENKKAASEMTRPFYKLDLCIIAPSAYLVNLNHPSCFCV